MRKLVCVLAGVLALVHLGDARAQQHRATHNVPPSQCPLMGDAQRQQEQQLNLLKNRTAMPTPADIDGGVTLQAMLAPGNDMNRFDERKAATITGFVVTVHMGGIETVNCHSTGEDFRDTHIDVALTPNASVVHHVIVEVTPRVRAMMAQQGIDWRTPALAQQLVGHRVTFTGWLMNDIEHKGQSKNTAPNNPNDWRATTWEIHPVMAIQVGP